MCIRDRFLVQPADFTLEKLVILGERTFGISFANGYFLNYTAFGEVLPIHTDEDLYAVFHAYNTREGLYLTISESRSVWSQMNDMIGAKTAADSPLISADAQGKCTSFENKENAEIMRKFWTTVLSLRETRKIVQNQADDELFEMVARSDPKSFVDELFSALKNSEPSPEKGILDGEQQESTESLDQALNEELRRPSLIDVVGQAEGDRLTLKIVNGKPQFVNASCENEICSSNPYVVINGDKGVMDDDESSLIELD
eukprot:TRINITY_DN4458_c0_g4_i3.p1 TRINITY_DN4458_c0_g4~~TRINITY_DN4458_c0_g4_i3.p1  ORF type:complete len:257 (-),score=49.99 TRINITY_DN4458_c0_g4_i3:202-972(-)